MKSGRARYAPGDENTIILTVTEKMGPTVENINLPEDIKVDNTINYTAAEQQNAGVRFDVTDSQYNSKMLSYVMSKIDELARYPQYIDNAIASVGAMPVNECPNGGTGDAARANAISSSVTAREETNRALIAFLKQVYEDVRPQAKTSKENSAFTAVMQSISELISSIDPDTDNASDVLRNATSFLQTAVDAYNRVN